MRQPVRTQMHEMTSESLSHPETSNGRAAGGNCVVARGGGEQPEAELRSQIQVNPFRFTSILAEGVANSWILVSALFWSYGVNLTDSMSSSVWPMALSWLHISAAKLGCFFMNSLAAAKRAFGVEMISSARCRAVIATRSEE